MKITNTEYLKLIQWPVIVLLVHIIAGYLFGLYYMFAWFDNPMHFTGGMSIASSSFVLFKILNERAHLSAKPFVYFLLAIALTALAAVGWEILEYLGDVFLGTSMQPSIYDTMKDLVLGLTGSALVALIQSYFKKL